MKLKYYTKLIALFASLSLITLNSCSEQAEVTSEKAETPSVIEPIILKQKPKEASTIAELRKSAKPGDQVTFKGDAIGALSIFMDDRAVMILGDPDQVTRCDLKDDDGCPTPWDVCCDKKEVIKASIVTLRFLDESGKVVKEGFKGAGGIKEMSSLVVSGTVDSSSNAENMVVNVSSIFVEMN